jgi:predicted ABC-class ATPase
MATLDVLEKKLSSLDGRDYGGYQSLIGQYDFHDFRLYIDQIPKDPYAPPHTGIYRVIFSLSSTGVPEKFYDTKAKEIAFRDYLARRFFNASQDVSKGRRGTGYSGIITIDPPSQAILERTSVMLKDMEIEVRCFIGLPASGRKIKSQLARKMLFEELPDIINRSLDKRSIDLDRAELHISTYENAEYLRRELVARNLVSFIADGAILPRRSGVSDEMLGSEEAIPFKSPKELKIIVELPDGEQINGMGIPAGITLIVGGGYHGKSTLLTAIEQGIYNHIPGDGREQCVSTTSTVKVRAYSGRYVEKTDISPFIRNLPIQKDTSVFCTDNASGSTSQAAAISEAIEAGAGVVLMDEDTCATNFMIRDRQMQELVEKKDEPITTFIDRARQLYSENGISSILVLGGVGDYFAIADKVIQMVRFEPVDVTAKAKKISETYPTERVKEDENYIIMPTPRIPVSESVNPTSEYGKLRVYATELSKLHFGKEVIDLIDVEQLIDLSQTKAIGQALVYSRKYMDGKRNLREVAEMVGEDMDKYGLDIISKKTSGHLARFRSIELVCTLNRLRGFKVKQSK